MVPKGTPSTYAEEGRKAHEWAEKALLQVRLPSELVGIPDDFKGPLDAYVRYIEGLDCDPWSFWIERKVYIDDDCWGTADFIGKRNNTLHVADLKFGKGVKVYVRNNTQLMIYALGALRAYGLGVNDLVLHIAQPRLDHFEQWAVSRKELERWGKETLRPKAQAALDPDAPRIAGNEQCRWCPAKDICPENALGVVSLFDDLTKS